MSRSREIKWSRQLPVLLIVIAFTGCSGPGRVAGTDVSRPTAAPLSKVQARHLLESRQFKELDARMSAVQAAYRAGGINDEQLHDAFDVF
ncbi:MAG: hypothetical protein ABSB70_06730 [Candidatus Velthaea sp.]|jgi:hypothetical protein